MIIEDADSGRYIGLFLAFGSQAVHTDEVTGHALPNSQLVAELLGYERPQLDGGVVTPRPDDDTIIPDDRRLAIVGALVNPVGPERQPDHTGRPELVYLMNRTSAGLSLGGWQLLNHYDKAHQFASDTWLAPGEVRAVTMGEVPLANGGGLMSLLDQNGLKGDGVSYTGEQGRRSGEIILFRV